MGLSHGTVSHWETGRRIPTPEDVASLLTAAGVTGSEKKRLVELARHAGEPNWLTVGMPGIPQQLAGAVECERAASAIVEWAPMVVPGLLQTTDYSRAISLASGLPVHETEARVMLRTARREVVTGKNPVHLSVLIGENAVKDKIGEPGVMADQLQHLLELGARDNVVIRVVPARVGWHPGVAGPFVLYDFPDSPPVVHFEHYSSGAFVPDDDDVQAYRHAVDSISRVALTTAATSEFIGKLAEQRERA
ncbi:helix-turn-helix transcriptional regulator [Saccharopolyspora taberi]|uniref:Helix-turn-helix transcriptional regulator n=1 Tax=Saccharopolyspora taberi TaxID=60895 RepID=A0ABN3VMG0_9PSEU